MKITVKDAAKRMGLHEETVRFGLREGRFPFGTAVQMKNRWNYIIFPRKFEELYGKGECRDNGPADTLGA